MSRRNPVGLFRLESKHNVVVVVLSDSSTEIEKKNLFNFSLNSGPDSFLLHILAVW